MEAFFEGHPGIMIFLSLFSSSVPSFIFPSLLLTLFSSLPPYLFMVLVSYHIFWFLLSHPVYYGQLFMYAKANLLWIDFLGYYKNKNKEAWYYGVFVTIKLLCFLFTTISVLIMISMPGTMNLSYPFKVYR